MDYNWTNWSSMKTYIDYSAAGAILQDRNYSSDWHDSSRYRIGMEYDHNDKFDIRAGILYDQTPLPDKGFSITSIPIPNFISYSLGSEYKINKKLSATLAFTYVNNNKAIGNVCYSIKNFSITVSTEYKL